MTVPCPDRVGRARVDARYDTSGRQRMDYCSTCRRHLNGALVCPGCGAYAPDIAPGMVGGHRVPGRAATGSAPRAAEAPTEGGWFTAPARSTETPRPDDGPRPVHSAGPNEGAGSAGSAHPASAGRPLDGARSADTTWPAGAGRPADPARPVSSAGAARTLGGALAGDAPRVGNAGRPGGETAPPAEGIRSVVPARRTEAAVFAAPARPAGTAPYEETARPAGTASPEETGGPAADLPHALPAGPATGRAARRRQLARWRKTQRRALVATAVALVGGGITLASTDRGGGDRTQAATAPDLHGMGGTGGTTDEAADAPSVSPDRTTAPPRAEDRRSTARPEAAPTTTAPPSGTHTDGAAATEVPAGGRSDASESVSRSGDRSEASRGTGGGAPGSGGSTAPTRPSTPPPSADDGSGDTGGDGGSDQGDGSSAQPAPSTPPPADEPRDPRLCLLVICLG
ncbi:hypothetical protein OIE82_16840 [Streptomyces althioticus]|uniref:Uncharacterized protein n=1 Tax=Streptomyces althioticus TaxID=83380 RepID=A0ABZ1Y7P9_9ACTN